MSETPQTDMTPAEAEATGESVSFDFFGRSWSVPTKTRLSHLRALRADPSNVGLVDTFLDAEQIQALDGIDPDADELDKFTDAMIAAQGFKSAGNS